MTRESCRNFLKERGIKETKKSLKETLEPVKDQYGGNVFIKCFE